MRPLYAFSLKTSPKKQIVSWQYVKLLELQLIRLAIVPIVSRVVVIQFGFSLTFKKTSTFCWRKSKFLQNFGPNFHLTKKYLGAEAKKVMWTNDMHLWIHRLMNYPADLHPLLPTMIDTMRMGVTHFGDEFNQIMVDAVYKTCMYDASFCFVGSKLCNVVSNSVKRTGESQIGFRSFLLQKLQKDFEERDFLVKSVNPNDRKVCRKHSLNCRKLCRRPRIKYSKHFFIFG